MIGFFFELKILDMVEENYRVVMSGTYKGEERTFSLLRTEKNKSEKKQKAKWLNLLFKINKIKEEK
jgi:hypothetical protein